MKKMDLQNIAKNAVENMNTENANPENANPENANPENANTDTDTEKAANGTDIVKFEIAAMNGKQDSLTFYNSKLIAHTQQIMKMRDAGNIAMLAIAHEFDEMDRDESYKTAGFKTVAEYGRIVFDYKPATVSLYLRSARAFITVDEKGLPKYKDGLPKLSLGQMIELLPLVKDNTDISAVIKGFVDGKLNDRMSTKAMRDGVSSIRAIDTKGTAANKEEKTELEKAGKLGAYDKEHLKKGVTSKSYALQNIEAAIEATENVSNAIADIAVGETVDSKIDSIMKLLTELRAELSKEDEPEK